MASDRRAARNTIVYRLARLATATVVMGAALGLQLDQTFATVSASQQVTGCVALRSADAAEERCSYRNEIPSWSTFYRSPIDFCSYYDGNGVLHTDGKARLWIEGLVLAEQPSGVDLTAPLGPMLATEAARFAAAYRTFTEFCDGYIVAYPIVALTDPLLYPARTTIDQLRSQITIPTLTLTTLPDPSIWGGLLVNNPTLLAINPTSWQPQTAGGTYRAWTTRLVAIPTQLDFTTNNTTVACQTGYQPADPATTRFPPEPAGFRTTPFDPPTNPLPARPCVYTPRTKGTLTITATVRYTVWFDYGSYRLAQPDFIRTTTITTPVVELADVNVIPTNG